MRTEVSTGLLVTRAAGMDLIPMRLQGGIGATPFFAPYLAKERPTFLPSAAQQGQPKVKEA